jgi:hypothetical protein
LRVTLISGANVVVEANSAWIDVVRRLIERRLQKDRVLSVNVSASVGRVTVVVGTWISIVTIYSGIHTTDLRITDSSQARIVGNSILALNINVERNAT